MCIVSSIITRLCDLIFYPFSGFEPVWGIAVISLLTAFFALWVYKAVSNQAAITRLKKRIQGHFLGIYLFRDDLSQILASEWKVFSNVLRYMGHAFLPLAVMIIPIVLICLQLQCRYGYSNPKPGDSILVSVCLSSPVDVSNADIKIETSDGLVIETPPLRIAGLNEIEWKLGVKSSGPQDIKISVGASEDVKNVTAGSESRRLYPFKGRASFLNCLLYPGEEPIDKKSVVRSIQVDYSHGRVNFMGLRLHWSIVYFALAIVFGFVFKGLFKVEF